MLRTLRVLAAISFAWMVGLFVLRFVGVGGVNEDMVGGTPLVVPFTTIDLLSLLSTLGGELGFAVGILALVETARGRQIAWCTLFALLLVLLHVLPMLIFRFPGLPTTPYFNFLGLFGEPPVLFGRHAWVVLLPALIPGVAFIYTLSVHDDGLGVAAARDLYQESSAGDSDDLEIHITPLR